MEETFMILSSMRCWSAGLNLEPFVRSCVFMDSGSLSRHLWELQAAENITAEAVKAASAHFVSQSARDRITMVMAPSRTAALALAFRVRTVASGITARKAADPFTVTLASAVRP